MKYLCLYYSATGNTERAVNLVRREIEASGSTADVVRLRKGTRVPDTASYDGLIVAFPVLSFSPPVFVKHILRSLPRAKAGPIAFVLAVDGGGGGPAAGMAARLLETRGYRIASCAKASYPDNWVELVEPPAPEACAARLREGDEDALAFAREIIVGGADNPSANRERSFALELTAVLFGLMGRRFLGKLFHADGDCDACGLCVRRCPSGSIILHESARSRPFWKMNCENCNACMNLCPKNAVNTSPGRAVLLIALVVAASWAGIAAWNGPWKAAVRWNLPPLPGTLADIAGITMLILLAHFFVLGPVDRYLLRPLQALPGMKAFVSWSFTKNFRRYRAPKLER